MSLMQSRRLNSPVKEVDGNEEEEQEVKLEEDNPFETNDPIEEFMGNNGPAEIVDDFMID